MNKKHEPKDRVGRVQRQWTPVVNSLREFILGPGAQRPAERDADSRTVHHIQKLAQLAEKGDEESAKVLLAITKGAVCSLSVAAQTNPDLFHDIARRQTWWPVIWSCIPSVRRDLQERTEALGIGTSLRKPAEIRLPFHRTKASFIAHQVLAYMAEVKDGTQDHPDRRWREDVRHLDPYTKESAPAWWLLAMEEIQRCFPNLNEWVIDSLSAITRDFEEALKRIRIPFVMCWRVFKHPSDIEEELVGGQPSLSVKAPNPPSVHDEFAAWIRKNIK